MWLKVRRAIFIQVESLTGVGACLSNPSDELWSEPWIFLCFWVNKPSEQMNDWGSTVPKGGAEYWEVNPADRCSPVPAKWKFWTTFDILCDSTVLTLSYFVCIVRKREWVLKYKYSMSPVSESLCNAVQYALVITMYLFRKNTFKYELHNLRHFRY